MEGPKSIKINGAWSDDANGWVSDVLMLTGSIYLEATLPDKGRMVIKKSETANGPWPKAMITPWTGPDFKVRIYGSTENRYIRIILTEEPTSIHYDNI